jgi:hypothetical protein
MKTWPDGAYHDGMHRLQERFDGRRLADRRDEKLGRTRFAAEDCRFKRHGAYPVRRSAAGKLRRRATGVRVRAARIFPNSPRHIHRMQPVESSPYVPRAGAAPVVPAWKRFEMFRDVLPRDDPARDAGSTPT